MVVHVFKQVWESGVGFFCFPTLELSFISIPMNPIIDNIENPEPKFLFHDEMIHWLQANMKVSLAVSKEYIRDIVLPNGNIISADYEFVNILATVTLNQQDVNKGEYPKAIHSSPIKLLIPKNDNAATGASTAREQRIYDDLYKTATRVNNLIEELQQLKEALKHVQYPLPEELQ